MIEWTKLENAPRILLEAELRPAQGGRFQPTGFADLGAATYQRPNANGNGATDMLLVESAQSVANRLERTILEGDGPDGAPEFAGLPYVAAQPHAAAELGTDLRDPVQVRPQQPAAWCFPFPARWRPRAVTGFIEAEDVKKVVSGGVKNSPVDPKGELQVAEAAPGEKGVYSNVPYTRIEFTARRITAYFNIDVALIRGYKLPDPADRLLLALAVLKIRRFLTTELRLRTACDLIVDGDLKAGALEVPTGPELLAEVQQCIRGCKPQFADPAVTELITSVKVVKKEDTKRKVTEEQAEEVTA